LLDRESHEVSVLCDCERGVEGCRMERYIADVRIAYAEIELLEATLRRRVPSAPLRVLSGSPA
jgi:hypothetical protein